MPRYLVERTVPAQSREQIEATARKAVQVYAKMGNIKWIKSYISDAEGKIYCEFEAPDPEVVAEASRRIGIPYDRISLISMELNAELYL